MRDRCLNTDAATSTLTESNAESTTRKMANPKHLNWLRQGVPRWNRRRDESPFLPDLSRIDLHDCLANDDEELCLRAINLANANLRGSTLSRIDLSGSNLTEADAPETTFDRTTLRSADLTHANLRKAEFLGCHLPAEILSANLTGAYVCGGSGLEEPSQKLRCIYCHFAGTTFDQLQLANARFEECDLTGAALVLSSLTNAVFVDCALDSAQFSGADCSGVDFGFSNLVNSRFQDCTFTPATDFSYATMHGARILESPLQYARLFRALEVPQWSIGPSKIDRLADLLEVSEELREFHGYDSLLYFRGEPECYPNLESSSSRSGLPEGHMLKELQARYPGAFSDAKSAMEEWTLAQHFGLKTPFLDVTRNPAVALFFACCEKETLRAPGRLHVFAVPRTLVRFFDDDAVAVTANFAKLRPREQGALLGRSPAHGKFNPYHAAVNALDGLLTAEAPHLAKQGVDPRLLYGVFLVEPRRKERRLAAQAGAFLISSFFNDFSRETIEMMSPTLPLYGHYRFEVPGRSKERCLRELGLINIRRETLFPEMESTAAAITEEYSRRRRGG